MKTTEDLLYSLDFGSVDAESETELAKRFVRTQNFNNISDENTLIILGPKGSGKSAMYRLFTDFPQEVHQYLEKDILESTHIVKATGADDVQSVNDQNLNEMRTESDFTYDKFWKIYIGLKTASKLGSIGYKSEGELGNVLQQLNEQQDWRLMPMLRGFWETFIGSPPSSGKVSYGKFSLEYQSDSNLDIGRLLEEEQNILEQKDEDIWLLFDRIDELQSRDPEERKKLLEALFRTQVTFMGRFPNIRLKIFLRTDIWRNLNFVNKSHIVDKRTELQWNDTQLLKLINKRMLQAPEIEEMASKKLNADISSNSVEHYDKGTQKQIFYSVFDGQVYPGEREAELFDWISERIKDGHGGKYPRELITFCTEATKEELTYDEHNADELIRGYAVRDAYETVSELRVDTYLSEFPELQTHFDRFDGNKTAVYTHSELCNMFEDLDPSGKTAIDRMVDVGFLGSERQEDGKKYEIPRLYRHGIGLSIRGRP